MAGASSLLWIAAALGVAGVMALRFAWSLPRRSAAWNGIGWGLLALSAVGAGTAEGAWGIAVAAIGAMGTAMILLAVAGIRSPRGRAAASNRRVGMLPEGAEPRRIGRRFGTFALVVLAGFAVAVGLAMSVRGLGGLIGWSEANANALALFVAPLAWAILATVLLMQTRRRNQLATLALCCLPVLPVILSGALS
jgi:hypothetical protein